MPVRLSTFDRLVSRPTATGGGIAALGPDFIVAKADGELVLLKSAPNDSLTTSVIPWRVPINSPEFDEDADSLARRDYFRVADLQVRATADSITLFASHHYWHRDRRCFTVRLSVASVGASTFPGSSALWRTAYESQPCLSIVPNERWMGFAGLQIGGSMVLLDSARVLLAVGDHGYDGSNTSEVFPQDRSVDYGKVVLINLAMPASQHFTIGHRNQQGMALGADGTIWETEHGPDGGDELNVLVQGRDYGWPSVTLGLEYGQRPWPLSATQGEHPGFEPPFFAWPHGLGISAIVESRGAAFPAWRGDLLVASMSGQQLFRVRVRGGRVQMLEPLQIGKRLRDLTQGSDGRILMWTDEGTVLMLTPVETTEASSAVVRSCQGCHPTSAGAGHGSGPNLAGIWRRRIGTAPGYEYSSVMRARTQERWTEDNLRAFLANPGGFATGTSMSTPGIRDTMELAGIIRYLRGL